jgi:hypothetical protein
MYLILYGNKDSYDRPIQISLESNLSTAEEADGELRDILISWLLQHEVDDELLEKCNFDYELYNSKLKTRIRTRITKLIKNDETRIFYNAYDFYEFRVDKNRYLRMITTGCPSDNEYDGETYEVIYI